MPTDTKSQPRAFARQERAVGLRRVSSRARRLADGSGVLAFFDGEWREAILGRVPMRGPLRSVEVIMSCGLGSQRVPAHNVAIRLAQPPSGKKIHKKMTALGSRKRRSAEAMPPSDRSRLHGGQVAKPAEVGIDAEVMRETDEVLHSKVDAGEAPGVVSVVYRHGTLAHIDCYGLADVERKLPMRPDSIVRLYSMTKCFTSVAVAICMEDGLLRLEDNLAKFIPAFANPNVKLEDSDQIVPAERPITLLHLLTHTSGLGYGPMLGDEADGEGEERLTPLVKRAGLGRCSQPHPDAVCTLEHWCAELAKIPLRSQPGTEWFYSYSHDVIGRVLEIVTGESLDKFMERRIFKPLQMVDTSFEIPVEKWDRVAGMYRRLEVESSQGTSTERDGEERPTYEFRRIDSPELSKNEWMVGNASPILSGGGCIDQYTGGLVSTAADFAHFSLMLLRKGEFDGVRILRESTVELFTKNMLPTATGSETVWAFNTAGVGFCLLGSVSVQHPDLDAALRPGEYGWGGMAGTAWTNDPDDGFALLSFSLVAFDLTTEEELRAGVRKAIERFASQEAKTPPSVLVSSPSRKRRLEYDDRLNAFDGSLGAAALITCSPPFVGA